jgi:hypothetical protein
MDWQLKLRRVRKSVFQEFHNEEWINEKIWLSDFNRQRTHRISKMNRLLHLPVRYKTILESTLLQVTWSCVKMTGLGKISILTWKDNHINLTRCLSSIRKYSIGIIFKEPIQKVWYLWFKGRWTVSQTVQNKISFKRKAMNNLRE